MTQDTLVTIDTEVPSCHVAVHRWQANTPDGKGNPFYFQHGRLGVTPNNGALVRMFRGSSDVDEDSRYPRVVTLTAPGVRLGTVVAITPDGRYLLTGECETIIVRRTVLPFRLFLSTFYHQAAGCLRLVENLTFLIICECNPYVVIYEFLRKDL